MTPESDCPVILLASGQILKMRKVELYDEETVKEITSLRSTAAFCLMQVSSVTGVLGSPAWSLLGGASAVSLVPGMLSGSLQKQAIGHLQNAHSKAESLIRTGHFFDAADITNIHIPHPQAWRAVFEKKQQAHNGDDFVNASTDIGIMSIRWSNVVAYFPPQT